MLNVVVVVRSNFRVILPLFLLGVVVFSAMGGGSVYAESFSGWASRCISGTSCVNGHSKGFTCTAATCSDMGPGTGDGQFIGPVGVAVDSSGNVYIVDYDSNHVDKFSSGLFVGWAGRCESGANCVGGYSKGFTCTNATCNGLGEMGSGDGQFTGPVGVAVNSSGNVYVTDAYNNRIDLFSAAGIFVGWAGRCSTGANCVGGSHSNGFTCTDTTCSGLASGSGDGQFTVPFGVAVNATGNVYVADVGNSRVDMLSSSGGFLGWAGGCTGGANCVEGTHSNGFTCTAATCSGLASGSGDGQFNSPDGVAVDSSGSIYVSDFFNNRTERFSGSGSFVGWTGKCTSGTNCDVLNHHSINFTCTDTTCSGLASGSGDGQFNSPAGVAVDSSGNVYITDYYNSRVEKFSGGVFSGWAGLCTSGTNCVTAGGADHSDGFTCTAATCSGLAYGSGDGQFDRPRAVAVDSSGNLYIADQLNGRVGLFSTPIGSTSLSNLLNTEFIVGVAAAVITILGILVVLSMRKKRAPRHVRSRRSRHVHNTSNSTKLTRRKGS